MHADFRSKSIQLIRNNISMLGFEFKARRRGRAAGGIFAPTVSRPSRQEHYWPDERLGRFSHYGTPVGALSFHEDSDGGGRPPRRRSESELPDVTTYFAEDKHFRRCQPRLFVEARTTRVRYSSSIL